VTTKTLIYKVARFNREIEGKSLQDLITNALKKRKAATSRKQECDSANQFRLINYHGPHKGIRVGEFFDYTHGHTQPLAKFDDDVDELEITALAPPDGESEFLHSILYFCIWKNSVILSQSMSLKSPQFESYINWLLAECDLLGEGDFVTLADQPPLGAEKEVINTKGIEFNAPVSLEPIEHKDKKSETKSVSFKPDNIGWDVLKKILPPEMTLPTELKASEVLLNSALEVTLMLHWSRLNRDDPTALLDRISNQLRHVDTELDYTIYTRSGKITRDEIKLRRQIAVGTNSDDLIKRSEMWERMQEWLEILVSEDKIVVDA
jgi:hypothetical protein